MPYIPVMDSTRLALRRRESGREDMDSAVFGRRRRTTSPGSVLQDEVEPLDKRRSVIVVGTSPRPVALLDDHPASDAPAAAASLSPTHATDCSLADRGASLSTRAWPSVTGSPRAAKARPHPPRRRCERDGSRALPTCSELSATRPRRAVWSRTLADGKTPSLASQIRPEDC